MLVLHISSFDNFLFMFDHILFGGSPDDWESFLHYLACLLEDQDISWHEETVSPSAIFKNKDCHLPKESVRFSLFLINLLLKKFLYSIHTPAKPHGIDLIFSLRNAFKLHCPL